MRAIYSVPGKSFVTAVTSTGCIFRTRRIPPTHDGAMMAKNTPAKTSPKKSRKAPGNALAAYLDSFPAATRQILDRIRETVRKAVPDAEEVLSYGVGAFKRGGRYVVYYAGYAKHVAMYPVYPDDPALGAAIEPYASGKATVRFKIDEPVPHALIAKIVKAKLVEHKARVQRRAVKTATPAKRKAQAKAQPKAPRKVASRVRRRPSK
jgi:uncharacterized protein YdhG (YjbR/CyaY superfamily)